MATAAELLAQARAQVDADNMFAAMETYRKVIDLDPNLADAYIELGRIELMRKEVFDEIPLKDGERSQAFWEAFEKGESLVDKGLSLEPAHPLGLAVKGLARSYVRDWPAAERILSRAVELDDSLTFAHFNLGRALFELGRRDEAEEQARICIRQNPRHFQAHFALGRVLLDKGQVREGMNAVLETLKVNPYFLPAYVLLSEFFIRTKKFEACENLLKEGLRHVPSAMGLYAQLLKLYLSMQDTEKALDVAQHLVHNRGDATDYMTLGNLYLASGQVDKAEEAYKKAAELAPDAWEPYFNLGEIYSATVDPKTEEQRAFFRDLAREQYQKALDLGGDPFKINNALGVIELEKGTPESLEAARDLFQKAMQSNPQAVQPRFNLALTLARQGERAQARQQVMDVLARVRPGTDLHQEAQRLLGTLAKMRD